MAFAFSSVWHMQGQALTLELGLSDATGTRRRVLFSSSCADFKATPLHCQVRKVSRGKVLMACMHAWSGRYFYLDD